MYNVHVYTCTHVHGVHVHVVHSASLLVEAGVYKPVLDTFISLMLFTSLFCLWCVVDIALHMIIYMYMYMRISENHNSLGCEQPSRPRC